ncbi:ArdC family protein [Bacteroides zoogleoformans]|uniref:ArdC family protein n=1 Tax=Bacteroides zoogleoformans TaxID=28119 RepID=UPI00248E1A87|nr:zincin-like metallopeptidase domain-containing protein [Bacteroides zoogleoformans]
MNRDNNAALQQYAELMIEKIKQVSSSDWKKPWFSSDFIGFPQNLYGNSYNNFNKLLLYFMCEKYSYQTPVFATFKQAQNNDFHILKGEKSFPVSFYDLNIKKITTGEKVTKDFYNNLSLSEKAEYKVIPFIKYYNVFNLDQTNFAEKYPEKWTSLKEQFSISDHALNDGYRNRYIDNTIENQTWVCPIELREQSRAYYSPAVDSITLPKMEQFPHGKEFYYTALHEMAHSTGHPERLGRKFGNFGSLNYAHEELIAEFSSALVGRDLGMELLPRKENAQYLKSWLSAIIDDPKYILGILGDVSKAVTMIEKEIGLENENFQTQTEVSTGNADTVSDDAAKTLKQHKDIPVVSTPSKVLFADVLSDNNKPLELSNLRILDKSIGKTEPLSTGSIDLASQPRQFINELLSGKKVSMTNKEGVSSLVKLNKTITGWGISAAKQLLSSADSSAGI